VGEGEIEHWLATQEPAAPPKPVTEYHISHILVAIPPQRDETAVRAAQARVAAVHQQLREGLSFAKAAREFSQGAEAPQGGQIGWRRLQDLPPAVAKLISSLKPGQLSPILRSNLGYHIFRLDRTRQQKVDRPVRTETRARHILLRTTELFTDEDARTQLQRFIERIKAGEDFGDLARAHSDDTATAARGGELDWVAAGTLDPAFAEAMNALPVGTVSQPVQSRFGWHIIEVLDRRTLDAADANAREEAHRQLRRKKAEERYDRFLRQLRDEAYIRYVAEEFAQ
jgi:peptidyl-prolyl cis-trans isomerase SurA